MVQNSTGTDAGQAQHRLNGSRGITLDQFDTVVSETDDVKSLDHPARSRQELQTGIWQFDIVEDITGLEALENDWNALFARCAHCFHVFQSFNWCWHWSKVFLPRGSNGSDYPKLNILTIRDRDRLVSVWPMVVTPLAGQKCLNWLGAPVSQYGDVLIEDRPDAEEILRSGLDYLRKKSKVDLLQFWKVRSDACIFRF